MAKILLDLEFTGLDNDFIDDNEVIELKMKNLDNGLTFIKNYRSDKPIGLHARLSHRVERYEGRKFSSQEFIDALVRLHASFEDEFIGFSVTADLAMLAKYEISVSEITDIKDLLILSEHEYTLATEGNGLEECYLCVTGKYPDLQSHCGLNELAIIEELYFEAKKLNQDDYLTVMPWGHCAGMDIDDYVADYRRNADGYRWNNCDVLAASLDDACNRYDEENSYDNDDAYYNDNDDDDDAYSDDASFYERDDAFCVNDDDDNYQSVNDDDSRSIDDSENKPEVMFLVDADASVIN